MVYQYIYGLLQLHHNNNIFFRLRFVDNVQNVIVICNIESYLLNNVDTDALLMYYTTIEPIWKSYIP